MHCLSVVTNSKELLDLCRKLEPAKAIGYDTEFISEGRYLPELCLIQIAAEEILALIDPLAVRDLTLLWELFCDGKREMLVHACRSEMEFCHRDIGKMPPKLFDIQLAAGFLGCDFPTSYSSLLWKFLHTKLEKSESRTDWKKRPLTPLQLDYAIDDVRHLAEMTQVLKAQLAEHNRLDWYYEESESVKETLKNGFEHPRWQGLPKISGLQRRELAVLRGLWFWRDKVARHKNIPAGRILRDDLIVELARRKTGDVKRIAAVRGLQRSDADKIVPELAAVIQQGLELPESELPDVLYRASFPQYPVMTQILYAALGSICEQQHIAVPLVGSPFDVREMIAAELRTLPEHIVPKLTSGWRAELVGTFLQDVLYGRKTLRLNCRQQEELLVFE
ncbi:MAG: HRDC domain-containing protein [Planctomycetaceae bacterium]|jgi:ribonuclease D|nr:HRDC domain-containing protein [Planctomycetaceae bacterium]